ncbi:maltase-glucoamylase-like [Styela clava]
MPRSRSSSISNMEIEEPVTRKPGLFGGDSRRTFMVISGIFAIVAVLTLVIVLPVYYTVIEPGKGTEKPITENPIITEPPPTEETTTVPIVEAERVDCYPDNSTANEEDCVQRGCTWSPSEENANAPPCVYAGPRAYMTEGETTSTDSAITTVLVTTTTSRREVRNAVKSAPNHFGTLFPKLTVTTTFVSETTLRVKIVPDEERYEVPLDHPANIEMPSDALFSVDHVITDGKFGVKVQRVSDSKVIFDTSVGEMMFADQFLQISTRVASEYIYGFGEHMHETFKHDMNWKTYGMFSRDQGVGPNVNLYGVHPYFMCMEGDGNAYGVYFVNSNAMDVTLQPAPAITYRSIGGVMDFYIFLGPSPEQVTDQYTSIIGRPYFPPYWSLGFQLCRYDYENLENLTKVVNRNLGKIPYEIQYSDIDYMERQLDFTIDNDSYYGLEDFVRNLKEENKMRYIIILDPAISGNETAGSYPPFDKGVTDDVFVKTPEGEIAWGKVWPDYPGVEVDESQDWDYQTQNYRAFAAFPDFNLDSTAEWWKDLTVDFHDKIPFDGLWIDMNEPASFVHGSPDGCPDDSALDYPPYVPHLASGNVYDKTLCMRNKQRHPTTGTETDHYNVHSLYGKSQGPPTVDACRASTGERCMVISRSTYPGSGKHVGHWLGDNASIWEHLRTSIIGIMEFNLFGIPYIGADVCGFFVDTTESLCRRWMQVGAFYPFDRNHNGKGWADQDPGYFGEQFLVDSKKVLDVRYTLLPYLYTLFYEAQRTGATVVRPMMNQFPNDINTYTADGQFMWGSALLITPVLTEATTSVDGYFPAGRWFDYYTGAEMAETGKMLTLNAPFDHINLHVYGGNIIPTQEPALTTFYSRQNPFGLIVVLNENGRATGELFWDDGTSIDTIANMKYTLIEFACESSSLTSQIVHSNTTAEDMTLGSIRVLGVSEFTTKVLLNGNSHHNFTYNGLTKELQITGLMVDLKTAFEIVWESTMVEESERIDCYPDNSAATQEQCWERRCMWSPGTHPDSPKCFYNGPRAFVIDGDTNETPSKISSTLISSGASLNHFGTLYAKLNVQTTYISGTTLRVKIYPDETRYEVPMEHPPNIDSPSDSLYSVEHSYDGGRFGVKVQRTSEKRVIFDTSVGEMMFADQFLQISTRVASEYIYGFGEHMHESFKHDMNWKTYGMFSRDQGVGPNVNLYGVHPYFMCMEGDGNAYGVYFVNSNAMDVTLQPAPAITYRSIGGVMDFYIFLGPSPEQVTDQYTSIIGRPYFPPYWSLGFQLCRYDYENLENLTKVVNRNLGKIPYEIQYSDIDYMERQLDFTIDNDTYYGLEDFVRNLKKENKMRYIIILDPAISGNETAGSYPPFDKGVTDDVFVKTPEGEIAWGKVWPDYPGVEVDESQDWDYQTQNYRAFAAFPDFNLDSTAEWWKDLTVDFHDKIPFDGLWIDMNEPASFVHGSPDGCPADSALDYPPYLPHLASGNVYDKTLCMRNKQRHPTTGTDTDHYNVHSLYGKSQGPPTVDACRASTGERCMVISRSTYPGSGKHVGHWLGDNASIWEHLRTSIIGIMEFNLFGIPYIGADVCGFFVDTTESLCRRWMQVGAFYPFDRNHNGKGWADQDPGYFGEQFLADSKKVLDVRYTLLPYLYTLFYEAQRTGATVVRPMMNQFPNDINTYTADGQFMWGSALLITPVLTEATTSVDGYFPAGRWFDYYTGAEMAETGKMLTLDAPFDHINLHLYGGNIIPTQEPALTTFYSRQNPFGLIVVLNENGRATGELFWDDGTSIDTIANMKYTLIEFACESSSLTSQIVHSNTTAEDMTLGSIRVLGVSEFTTKVLLNGNSHHNFTYNGLTKELQITGLMVDLKTAFEIVWESTMVEESERIDCYPDNSAATQEQCWERRCMWSPGTHPDSPKCFYNGPRAFVIDGDTNETPSKISSTLISSGASLNHFGTLYAKLNVQTTYISGTTLRVKIYPDETRYEVPMEHPPNIDSPSDSLYSVEHSYDGGRFGVKVQRTSEKRVIFDTSVGEMMFADQFLQITTRVASEYIYGFGEHMHETFKHDMNWKTYGMFSRDQFVGANVNLYGVHPYFMCMEGDGNAYGVFFVNSNAMDVTLQPAPAITYRSVGGVMDFYIFLGPSPEQVTEQYTSVIGRPYFPPYWSLGFQLCRYDYENLDNLTKVVNRNLRKIPYEIQYSDIDYMERQLDFTIDNDTYYGLGDFVRNLKEENKMRYIIILDPAISGNETAGSYPPFDDGKDLEVFIKTPEGDIAWGKVWPDYPGAEVDESQDWDYQTQHYRAFAAFPDFNLDSTAEWWKNLTVDFHNRIPFDGLWIDMNEPASFVHGSPNGCPEDSGFDNPPYVPNLASGNLYDKTTCMRNKQRHPTTGTETDHYNVHSLYGKSQGPPTVDACRASTGERCMVISRSTYPGSGKHVGHWLGDNTSIWEHLRTSIIGIMEFNLFGIPYIGADVCGFFADATESLCRRWMQVGAFYPFDRNHNSKGSADQDPGYFGEEFLADSKKVLDVRYTLLPYLYTLFYEAQRTGATVVRPMMNQFPNDLNTYTADGQFMWGSALLITPVLTEATTSVEGYFPAGRWFDYYNGEELSEWENGKMLTLNAPLDHINLHLYGGNIIPTQEPALTTFYSRQKPFGLIVVLDENGKASGELFWDDGTSIDTIANMEYTLVEFSCESSVLSSRLIHTNTPNENMTLGTMRIMGVTGTVTRIVVDGVGHDNFTHDASTNEVSVKGLTLDLMKRFEIRWEVDDAWKRVDCMPSKAKDPKEAECTNRGCMWDASGDGASSPLCYYMDSATPGYSVTTRSGSNTYTLTRSDATTERYGTPVESLQLDLEYQTDNRLHFKIKDATGSSTEIPSELNNFPTNLGSNETKAHYRVEITDNPFSIKVSRNSTGKVLFDTSVGPVVYEEKYREISTNLPSDLVFGLGEHNHRRYRHNLNWKRWAIFSRDVAPVDEWNLYGHQTFYMSVDDPETGTAVGVYFHNSNAMDVFFTPDPKLTYRTVGGVLDFYIFIGNTQEEVVQHFHNFIGLPMMPPYWGLGFQLSRWGYESLDEVKGIVDDMRAAKIPFDVQYGDIDYMERYKSFTYDNTSWKGLPAYVDELHDLGMRYVIILDPGILIEDGYKAYDEGLAEDIYIKTPDGSKPIKTEVWPGETYHPDYTHPNATSWWTNQCQDFYVNQNVKYDALWVDMNEPANFQPDNATKLEAMNCSDEYNRPAYIPNILWYGVGLHDKTLCMENQQYMGLHYDLHSLYGHTMSIATYEALQTVMPDHRSFVITRSTFTGTGKYAGHWLGDNQSQWRQMPWPIPAMFEFNLFGFPYIGADVCGFWFNTTEEMCQRWMQVGAFYPFSRNHNAKTMISQHPTAFGADFAASSKQVLEIRYSILPYMYTLHYQASTFGGTVVRALVHEFPQDKDTWDADRQFLLGSGFLITPVLDEGAVSVTGYFPKDARWYDYRTGEELTQSGRFVSLDAPLDYINLHVRGGFIIPRQNSAVTTTEARKNPMSLLVPLDDSDSAMGTLYWDDGEARNVGENYALLNFSCTHSSLQIDIVHPAQGIDISTLHFEKITVYGVLQSVGSVTVSTNGGAPTAATNKYNAMLNVLDITGLNLTLSQSHEVIWT